MLRKGKSSLLESFTRDEDARVDQLPDDLAEALIVNPTQVGTMYGVADNRKPADEWS
jgi:hypothetical protein